MAEAHPRQDRHPAVNHQLVSLPEERKSRRNAEYVAKEFGLEHPLSHSQYGLGT